MRIPNSAVLSFLCLASKALSAEGNGNLFGEDPFGKGPRRERPSGDVDISQIKGMKVRKERREQVLKHWAKPGAIQNAKPREMTLDEADVAPGNGNGKGVGNGNRGTRRRLQLVGEGAWVAGGDVLHAAGRLLFTMGGRNYLCSATAVTDGDTPDRSLILTAAHCVFDDSTKKFASYFMFIPNQDGTTGSQTDFNCDNDPMGCWTPSFAVIDEGYASETWSANIKEDYAFLVVDDENNHQGPAGVNDALDVAVPALDISFVAPSSTSDTGATIAMGYSGSLDPDFRYCVQGLYNYPTNGGYVLFDCALTGGSSGGPWFLSLDASHRGEIIAVNSYGPGSSSSDPYMGGPRMHSNSAQCLYEKAKVADESEAGGDGIIVTYKPGDCEGSTYVSGLEYLEGTGGGQCAPCMSEPISLDQVCCDAFGNNFWACYVYWGRLYCCSC